MSNLDTFVQSYVETALWSSTDEDSEPLDSLYSADDIHPDALAKMKEDCKDFLEANAQDIGREVVRAGHDFWLTRNHHGAGFWDGDWKPAVGKRLTEASHVYGSSDLYVGDDDNIHVM